LGRGVGPTQLPDAVEMSYTVRRHAVMNANALELFQQGFS
jgi:hypothetical protein